MKNNMTLLLGSGGYRSQERRDLWKKHADVFLSDIDEVLFIPYAGFDDDAYVQSIDKVDFHVGRKTVGIHTFSDPLAAIANAKAIHVGGGNTFRLLHRLQQDNLLAPIADAVKSGTPYLGISAGSNVACPSIATTNDMPIVMPNNFDALHLVPFQINAHYFAGVFKVEEHDQWIEYAGESREDRLREFHRMNTTPVMAMPEGTHLTVKDGNVHFYGGQHATLFQPNKENKSIADGHVMTLDDF